MNITDARGEKCRQSSSCSSGENLSVPFARKDGSHEIMCGRYGYTGYTRNNSHILKGSKNKMKQSIQKILLLIKSTYNAVFKHF